MSGSRYRTLTRLSIPGVVTLAPVLRCRSMDTLGTGPTSTLPLQQTRRTFLVGSCGLLVASCCRPGRPPRAAVLPGSLAEIEARVGGRVGVYAVDTDTERELTHRSDERFALCSTFKWVLAAAVLARVDRGELSLDERVPYGESELLEYAPVTREHLDDGSLPTAMLLEAAVTVSDNTAANLLLNKVGGPGGWTRYVRSLGDPVTRLDRVEPSLNSNAPGDPRDTTSPRAMAHLMRRVLCGDALSSTSRQLLLRWLRASTTGQKRLRAGLPPDWLVGDKTGSGARNAVNDVAIAVPPRRSPILIAAYLSESAAPLPALEAAHADIARVVAHAFRGGTR
jgi:beta-lactamase class A